MSKLNESNAESLFRAARNGDKYAFSKLIPNFYQDIYTIIFKIIPSETAAQDSLVETFVLAAENVQFVKEDKDFFEWLRKIATVVALYNLREKPLYNGGDSEIPPKYPGFSKLEELYASFTDVERVIITLYLELDYDPEKIAGYITDQTKESIQQLLNEKLERLCFFTESKSLVTGDKTEFFALIENHNLEDQTKIDQFKSEKPESFDLFTDFFYSCSRIFKDISVRETILDDIRDELINESKINERNYRRQEQRNLDLNRIAAETARQTSTSIGSKTAGKAKKIAYRTGTLDSRKLIIFLVSLMVIAAAVYGYMEYSKFNTPWTITAIKGDASVNGTSVTEIHEGDVASVAEAATAEITIPGQGVIKLFPNSSLTLRNGHKEDNRFDINASQFELRTMIDTSKFVEFADIPPFRIKTGNITISTEVAALKYIEATKTLILDFGWLEVKTGNEVIPLASGHFVDLTPNNLLYIPINSASDSSQKSRLLIMNREGLKDDIFAAFVVNATETEALAMVYLVKRSSGILREKLVLKMEELFPAIDPDIRNGLLKLDQDAFIYLTGFLKWNLLF
jgi:DNA-directed RNA polymerase specialized sigma24 family protein